MIVCDVKEILCYIAIDYDTEMKSTAESFDKEMTFVLQDSNIITVGAERFRIASCLPWIGFGRPRPHGVSDVPHGTRVLLTTERVIVCDVKEMSCCIALDSDTEMKSTAESFDNEMTFELQDNNIITVSAERFRCPDVWFQPNFFGKEASGIHDTSSQSITK